MARNIATTELTRRDTNGWEFHHNGFRYIIVVVPGQFRVQLWWKNGDRPWQVGHSRFVSDLWNSDQMVRLMYRFITGEISNDEYNSVEL